ncbi:MAG: hypothetical protein QNJ30_18105 [Kiloniellales bacterium]|nr:hypothetical protein [Kiloniellales bacterium]
MADHSIQGESSTQTDRSDQVVPERRRAATMSLTAFAMAGLIALTACVAPMPLTEGPRARLISGIAEPRDRNNMDITLYEYSVTAWGKCLELASTRSPVSAVFSVVTLSPYHACSVVPRDHELRAGQRPWCIVAVPKGDEELLEHELRHCEGWAAPKPKTARMRDWPDDQDS